MHRAPPTQPRTGPSLRQSLSARGAVIPEACPLRLQPKEPEVGNALRESLESPAPEETPVLLVPRGHGSPHQRVLRRDDRGLAFDHGADELRPLPTSIDRQSHPRIALRVRPRPTASAGRDVDRILEPDEPQRRDV